MLEKRRVQYFKFTLLKTTSAPRRHSTADSRRTWSQHLQRLQLCETSAGSSKKFLQYCWVLGLLLLMLAPTQVQLASARKASSSARNLAFCRRYSPQRRAEYSM